MEDPATSRPYPGVVPALARLVDAYRLVAVISGRPAAFLATHLAVDGLERWGSYGLEQVAPDGSVVLAESAKSWQPVVASVVAKARRTAPSGVGVEDKGVSVTFHLRNAPSEAAWVRSFTYAQAQATGLVEHEAKMSVELRPPLDVDKGTVVVSLLTGRGASAACFVGDDVGDLSAFAALGTLVSGGVIDTAVRVGVRSDESPAVVLDRADLVVDGPRGVLELLEELGV